MPIWSRRPRPELVRQELFVGDPGHPNAAMEDVERIVAFGERGFDVAELLPARPAGPEASCARPISRIRHASATGKLTFRADAAFHSRAFVTACQDHDVASITVNMSSAIGRAIGRIDDDGRWTCTSTTTPSSPTVTVSCSRLKLTITATLSLNSPSATSETGGLALLPGAATAVSLGAPTGGIRQGRWRGTVGVSMCVARPDQYA